MRSVVVDCPDPKQLADFYSALLGWQITSVEPEWVVVTDGEPERLCFQLVPGYRPPEWPGAERAQQFHLDLTVDDLDAAEASVLALGGIKHAHQPSQDDAFRVYLDPAGHPFCLCVDRPS
ncbi:putative enzyme related to lactoylglutathione lyase [Streptosporangium becharense]|uniref:Putative enzyme related to lactoylglutathione lyase n=1 Tax=Streptosporangium becharense TaxID=1816182 RepID=A0A7W9IK64_9ACTN|nr:VOC family protein [Streptosporangium becharense]MBB2913214.1 putative enzyme related to lactoylglutathione lyase [Streptosporangium becharense]MBB5822197.1 putative enzyme related to lactoylglutathione lyase [Streptosporangium becharense]